MTLLYPVGRKPRRLGTRVAHICFYGFHLCGSSLLLGGALKKTQGWAPKGSKASLPKLETWGSYADGADLVLPFFHFA